MYPKIEAQKHPKISDLHKKSPRKTLIYQKITVASSPFLQQKEKKSHPLMKKIAASISSLQQPIFRNLFWYGFHISVYEVCTKVPDDSGVVAAAQHPPSLS